MEHEFANINNLVENQIHQDLEKQYNQYLKSLSPIFGSYFRQYTVSLVPSQRLISQYKFHPTSNMMPNRQLQYINSLYQNNPISLEMMTEWLKKQTKEKSRLIKRKRNCGTIINQKTIAYAWDNRIHRLELQINQNLENNSLNIQTKNKRKYQGEGQILEILNFRGQDLLMIRQLYRIVIMHENQVKYKYFTDVQITNSIVNPFKSEEISLTTYNPKQNSSDVIVYEPGQQANFSVKQDKYIISMDHINRWSLIVATYDSLSILDKRAKTSNSFYQQQNKAERRILDLVWARSQVRNTPYFIVGNSTYVEIYDIRNNKSSVGEHRHYSQQSPPINYSVFQSNHLSIPSPESLLERTYQHTQNMMVFGYSPNRFGASICTPFPQILMTPQSQISCERYMAGLSNSKRYFGSQHPLTMLYNYSNQSSGQKQNSVIPYLSGGRLFFFHGGSNGSLKAECFKNNGRMQRVKLNKSTQDDQLLNHLQRLEEQRFIQPISTKQQQNNEQLPSYKINYSIYRCISDVNLRAFVDQLFRKARQKRNNVEINKSGPIKKSQLVVKKRPVNPSKREGFVDDELLERLQDDW